MAMSGLDEVRSVLAAADPAGTLAPCGLQRLRVGSGAIHALPEVVGEVATGRAVVLLVDQTPIGRVGADVKALAHTLLSRDFDVRLAVLTDGHSELHVTDEVVRQAVDAARGADVIVALGGGTISDIGKLVALEHPVPVVTVMTAASVDGYTDDVSVTLKDGVKRTVPSVWPAAVLADAETVAEAPARMNRAGYGEMTSMYVAPADWRLASLIGIDDSYHRAPVALLSLLAEDLDTCAPGVAAADPEAVEQLTWALALRGIATGVAGTTACLSGVEHLISHMLDLRAAELALPTGLHGEQVGVGSVIAAAAWEMLAERLERDPAARVELRMIEQASARERVQRAFDAVEPSGRISAECWRDYGRKLDAVTAQRDRIDAFISDWLMHRTVLQELVRPSVTIARGLQAAGASTTMRDLAGIDPQTAHWAVANCALMRNRFTVVDLLTILGWWETADVDEVLARATAAVAMSEVPA